MKKRLYGLTLLCLLHLAPFSAAANPFEDDRPVCPFGVDCKAGSGGAAEAPRGRTVETNRPGQTAVIPNVPIEPDPSSVTAAPSGQSEVDWESECSCDHIRAAANPGLLAARCTSYLGHVPRCPGGRNPPRDVPVANPPYPGESQTDTAAGGGTANSNAVHPTIPGWSTPPPPGVGRVGPVPGPANMGEAIVGVVLPGLTIILGGLLGGLFGNPPPVNAPQTPAAGEAEDTARAAAEAAAREAAERQTEWIKQREEDLRQVRDQKSFIAAAAAGTRQGGFDTSEHDRRMEELTRREGELTTQISSAGGDSSYVAKERDAIKVGAGFTEAIKIAQEFDRQQAIAAARAKMEELEKARLQAERDYARNVRDGFIQNIKNDIDAIPGQLKDAAKAGLRTIGTVVHDVGEVLADKESWKAAAIQTIADLAGSPLRSARKVADFYGDVAGEVASTAAAGAAHVVTHPLDTIKAIAGVDNWEKVFDPNVPVTERIGRYLVGVLDAGANIAGAKATFNAAADAAKMIGKALEAPAEVAKVVKNAAQVRANARAAQIAKGRYDVVEDLGVNLKGADGKLAGSKSGHMSGVTVSAQKHAQVIADKYGVKIDVRSTTPYAHDRIANGTAVPKAPHCKSKTINDLDVQLGASDKNKGLAGYFEPKKPVKGDMSDDAFKKLTKRYNERIEEYKDQAEHLEELKAKGKCHVKDGVVYDTPTGKPYTGDHDIFEIRDATTGQPLSRYQIDHNGNLILNADGTPKLNPVRERIIKDMQQPPFNAQHGAHMDWKYDHLSKEVPAGAPPGTNSDYAISQGIDEGVLNKHTEHGGDALITYGADRPPVGSWLKPREAGQH
jgi:hypothetical protein